MTRLTTLLSASILALGLLFITPQASQAQVGVGVNVGPISAYVGQPAYYGGYRHHHHYYPPRPLVVVQPQAPVYVQPTPSYYVQPSPSYYAQPTQVYQPAPIYAQPRVVYPSYRYPY